MTGLLELLYLKAGKAIAKYLFKSYMKDYGGEIAAELTDIGSDKIKDFFSRREHARIFDDMSARIIEELHNIGEGFDTVNREAVALQVGECFRKVSITRTLLEKDLSAAEFEKSLLRLHPASASDLSEPETALYNRVIHEFAFLVSQIASQLPEYNEAFAKQSLSRLTQVLEDVKDLSQKIDDISKRISASDSEYNNYELSYRLAVARSLDQVELIGITLPYHLQSQPLVNSFVKLSLTAQAGGHPRTARAVLGYVNGNSMRLLIRGDAGIGKSTLSKWIAIQCAMQADEAVDNVSEVLGKVRNFSHRLTLNKTPNDDVRLSQSTQRLIEYYRNRPTAKSESELNIPRRTPATQPRVPWQDRVPFVIKVRDFPAGDIPAIDGWPEATTGLAGSAPEGWMLHTLRAGRALIILDGIDELPNFSRDPVRRKILSLTSLYPNNLYIVTTRPSAVPNEWLKGADFHEVTIDPLTVGERNELITKWHSSLEETGFYDLDRIEQTAQKLVNEISSVPAIALIAVNPLLCAMICALNIDRRGQLPKTQRDLCNALVEALLHRRDAEQRIPLNQYPENYAAFTLDQKKR